MQSACAATTAGQPDSGSSESFRQGAIIYNSMAAL